MNNDVVVSLIAGGAALIGGVIGGLISMMTAKMSADREDKRRREELERQTAKERLDNLYEPLLRAITPGPPYDEFYLDNDDKNRIIGIIEKNELHASPDLLDIFWDLRRALCGVGKFNSESEWVLLRLVSSEHSKLKEIIGYGRIIQKDSIFLEIVKKIKGKAGTIFSDIRRRVHVRQVRRWQRKNRH